MAADAAYFRAYRAAKQEQGLCIWGGCTEAADTTKFCRGHNEHHLAKQQERRRVARVQRLSRELASLRRAS